jgi:hypothetical protein
MFIYSLPLFFSETGLGSPLELFLIALILFIILLLSVPYPDNTHVDRPFNYPLYNYILFAWQGQLALWRVFWPFFILLNGGIFAADYSVKSAWISVSSWDDAHFMFFLPSLFWAIAVWRNSENTNSPIGAAYARLMSLSVFFEYGLKLLIRHDYASLFFGCQDGVIDYLSCF